MNKRLYGQVAIVTGAGSGMGRATARLFAECGAKVVAADINTEGVKAWIAELSPDCTGEAVDFTVDVSKQEEVEAMIDFAVARFGTLNILVNNAGIMDKMEPVDELSNAMWERVLGVNLSGVMYACRKAIPIMRGKNGKIINIASVGGLNGSRAGAAYTASKHAVVGLTKNTAFMYANQGIRCNAVAPGSIETNIGLGLRDASAFGMERTQSGTGLSPRFGQAEEVAEAVLFLATDASSFINGTVITVDGGWTAF